MNDHWMYASWALSRFSSKVQSVLRSFAIHHFKLCGFLTNDDPALFYELDFSEKVNIR